VPECSWGKRGGPSPQWLQWTWSLQLHDPSHSRVVQPPGRAPGRQLTPRIERNRKDVFVVNGASDLALFCTLASSSATVGCNRGTPRQPPCVLCCLLHSNIKHQMQHACFVKLVPCASIASCSKSHRHLPYPNMGIALAPMRGPNKFSRLCHRGKLMRALHPRACQTVTLSITLAGRPTRTCLKAPWPGPGLEPGIP
jgi:hypothetical protein